MNAMLEAALAAARRGGVFPAYGVRAGRCRCGRERCGDAGKHPMTRRGFHDATTNPTIIHRWFADRDDVNLGAVTGSAAGYWVLDEDPDKGGAESLAELEAAHGQLPETPLVLTGGGGMHFLFAYPAGREVRGRVRVRPGLDVRGDGGYHILPPSLHLSGRCHAWDAGAHPDDVPLAAAPPWLLDLVTKAASESHSTVDMDRVLAGVPAGERNDTLFRAACKLRGADVPYDFARSLILGAAATAAPPLPEREALKLLDSAYRRYAPRPSRVPPTSPARPRAPLQGWPGWVATRSVRRKSIFTVRVGS